MYISDIFMRKTLLPKWFLFEFFASIASINSEGTISRKTYSYFDFIHYICNLTYYSWATLVNNIGSIRVKYCIQLFSEYKFLLNPNFLFLSSQTINLRFLLLSFENKVFLCWQLTANIEFTLTYYSWATSVGLVASVSESNKLPQGFK